MAKVTDAPGQADLAGETPNAEAAAGRRVVGDPGPATAPETTDGTAAIPVAANGDPVVQTRDPYHGVRDRGQCGPAARAVRRCRASPNDLTFGQQASE